MAQSKYINSFDTTAEYNEYIVSADASFPNIGYDRQADDVHILKERPKPTLYVRYTGDRTPYLYSWYVNSEQQDVVVSGQWRGLEFGTSPSTTETINGYTYYKFQYTNPNIDYDTLKLIFNDSRGQTTDKRVPAGVTYWTYGGGSTVDGPNRAPDEEIVATAVFEGTLKFSGGQVSVELLDENENTTTLTVNTSGTNFSLDSWGDLSDITAISIYGDIDTITTFNLDLSTAPLLGGYNFIHDACAQATSADLSGITGITMTQCDSMFQGCTALETLNINGWHLDPNDTMHNYMFDMCDVLSDVYIDDNDTFEVLTGNGNAAYPETSSDYIPSNATIHFNGTDYTWDGSAWMTQ